MATHQPESKKPTLSSAACPRRGENGAPFLSVLAAHQANNPLTELALTHQVFDFPRAKSDIRCDNEILWVAKLNSAGKADVALNLPMPLSDPFCEPFVSSGINLITEI